ncbi:hypothetical protein NSQ20_12205 [Paenibacillus sp. FSL K6-1122]|uniref:hypothetical protein n=1 Tax=Paenibacillus sp. FSL K6-1122 TaxID=2954512 RepID=UPI0030ECE6DA
MSKTYVKIFEDIEYYRILYAGADKQIAENTIICNVDQNDYRDSDYASHTLQIWENGMILEEIHTDVDGKEIEDEQD